MNLNRETAWTALERLQPALAKGGKIPELTHIWFDGAGAYASAFDGGLGIRVPFPLEAELACGVPGQVLLGLLNATQAEDIEVGLNDKGKMSLKMGRAKAQVPVLLDAQCPWPFPYKFARDKVVDLSEELLDALRAVMVVRQRPKAFRVEHHGVIFVPGAKGTHLYATDDLTLARAYVPGLKLPDDKPLILPRGFVSQIVKMYEGKLYLQDDCALAESADTLIGTVVLDASTLLDLKGVMAPYVKKDAPAIERPADILEALKRLNVMGGEDKNPFVKMVVQNQILRLSGKFDLGAASEELPIEETDIEAEAWVRLESLQRLLLEAETLAFPDGSALVLRSDNLIYVVAGKET